MHRAIVASSFFLFVLQAPGSESNEEKVRLMFLCEDYVFCLPLHVIPCFLSSHQMYDMIDF